MTKKSNIIKPEIRVWDSPVKLVKRDGEGEGESRTITGYAFKYDVESKVIGGWFKEIIRRGALEGCDLSDVVARMHHRNEYLLGRNTSATLRLFDEPEGLRYEIDLPNATAGNDCLEYVQRGDMTQSSFEFGLGERNWIERQDDVDLREITRFAFITDVSPVVRSAYGINDVSQRSLEQAKKDLEDFKRKNQRGETGLTLAEARALYKQY